MRLSSVDQEKIADIYEKMFTEGMTEGGMMGGVPTTGGSIENSDNYAKGNTCIPYVVGKIQTRKGSLKKLRKKRKKKSVSFSEIIA